MKRNFGPGNKHDLPKWVRAEVGDGPEVVFGIWDDRAATLRQTNQDWIYLDHSYFHRGWDRRTFRAVRNGLHLSRMLDRPDDRLRAFDVQIDPWRKTGRSIVVICPSPAQMRVYDNHFWVRDTLERLSRVTDRPVTVKIGKQEPLVQVLRHAWAVVTYASVAGVEAALMGVPVFSTPECPSWPVNAGSLEDIETPIYSDERRRWASGLAYASWHIDEIEHINWRDYNYDESHQHCS